MLFIFVCAYWIMILKMISIKQDQIKMHKLKIQEKKNKIQKPKQRSKISKTQRKKT